MKLKHWIERFRSSVTGRFVTKAFAKLNPMTTVRERRRK